MQQPGRAVHTGQATAHTGQATAHTGRAAARLCAQRSATRQNRCEVRGRGGSAWQRVPAAGDGLRDRGRVHAAKRQAVARRADEPPDDEVQADARKAENGDCGENH